MEGDDQTGRGEYPQLPSFEDFFNGNSIFSLPAPDDEDPMSFEDDSFFEDEEQAEAMPAVLDGQTPFHQQLEAVRSSQPVQMSQSDTQVAPYSFQDGFPEYSPFPSDSPPLIETQPMQMQYPVLPQMPVSQPVMQAGFMEPTVPSRQARLAAPSSSGGLLYKLKTQAVPNTRALHAVPVRTVRAVPIRPVPSAPVMFRTRSNTEPSGSPAQNFFAHFQKRTAMSGKFSKKTATMKRPCHCTKSQCLKLYCDCFAAGDFCTDCACKGCHNSADFPVERSRAVNKALSRNPHAFRSKISVEKKGLAELERTHRTGCHCKKSNCLKNYCECYEAGVACTPRCKCRECSNTRTARAHREEMKVTTSPVLIGLTATRFMNTRASTPLYVSSDDGDSDCSSYPEGPEGIDLSAGCPSNLLNDQIVKNATNCLLEAANTKNNPIEAECAVLDEFARCLQSIIESAVANMNLVNDSSETVLASEVSASEVSTSEVSASDDA